MIDGICESWQQGDQNTTFPRITLSVSSDDAMDDCICNMILNFDIIYNSPEMHDNRHYETVTKILDTYDVIKN
jgi:hypothetical protein